MRKHYNDDLVTGYILGSIISAVIGVVAQVATIISQKLADRKTLNKIRRKEITEEMIVREIADRSIKEFERQLKIEALSEEQEKRIKNTIKYLKGCKTFKKLLIAIDTQEVRRLAALFKKVENEASMSGI